MAETSGAKVCAVGAYTSGLAVPYLEHTVALSHDQNERSKDAVSELQLAFRDAKLNLSSNQVSQLVKSVTQSRTLLNTSTCKGERSSHPLGLSWGEFCVCCVEAQSMLSQQNSQSSEKRLYPLTSGPERIRQFTNRGLQSGRLTCKCEVFLGGSCNPTTWRMDKAIPHLKRHGITFFNPQVDEWYPELIEIEERAKGDASVLLFVVDNQTRAVSSMVEIAYFAGQGKEMIVVVEDMCGVRPCVGGEELSEREVADLNRGRAFVRHYLESGCSVLEESIEAAVDTTAKVLRDSLTVSTFSQSSRPLRLSMGEEFGDELSLMRQVFMMYDHKREGRLTLQEAEVALKSLHIEVPSILSALEVSGVIKSHDRSPDTTRDLVSHYKQNGISFEDFCTLYAEIKYSHLQPAWNSGRVYSGVRYLFTQLSWIGSLAYMWSPLSRPAPPTQAPPPFCDVFLGGSCGETTWRDEVAVPIFKQHGVSYFNPQLPHWDVRMVPIEREAKERSSVLLFVICGDTLSVASMVEVSYYLGQRRSIVLCISDIPKPSSQGSTVDIEGMKLSQQAVKDYNRGRAYLASMANKSRVQIFNNVQDAVHCAVRMVKGRRPSNAYNCCVPLNGTSV